MCILWFTSDVAMFSNVLLFERIICLTHFHSHSNTVYNSSENIAFLHYTLVIPLNITIAFFMNRIPASILSYFIDLFFSYFLLLLLFLGLLFFLTAGGGDGCVKNRCTPKLNPTPYREHQGGSMLLFLSLWILYIILLLYCTYTVLSPYQ